MKEGNKQEIKSSSEYKSEASSKAEVKTENKSEEKIVEKVTSTSLSTAGIDRSVRAKSAEDKLEEMDDGRPKFIKTIRGTSIEREYIHHILKTDYFFLYVHS